MLSKTLFLPFLTLTASAAVYEVDVGKSGLAFNPQTLTPSVGDTVIFHLYVPHNVATGPFSSPCQPNSNGTMFYSGPFSGTDNGSKKFVVNVTSTDPVYYYCAVPHHCSNGMVGGWNLPSSGNDIKAYTSAASSATNASAPAALTGGQLLDDSQLASITASRSSASSTPASSPSPVKSGSANATASGAAKKSTNAAMPTALPGAMALGLGVAALIL